jgi:FKBP-type peptidyl-prolyl cis-trans isomerase FkpA
MKKNAEVLKKSKINWPARLIMGAGLVTLVSCNSGKSGNVKLEKDEDKVFYSVGVMFGEKLKDLQLSPPELDFLVMGLREAVKGDKPQVDISQYQMKVRDLFNDRMKKLAQTNVEQGKKFLETYTKGGGQVTASGLAYKMIKEGTGKAPKAEDTVEVHYHGTLLDGTVFDSSVERNAPVKFPLNRVIRGWTEGLQLVKEGGKIELIIPSELGYGENGAPPKIPGGATLKFEVELLKIVPAETAPEAKKEEKPKK